MLIDDRHNLIWWWHCSAWRWLTECLVYIVYTHNMECCGKCALLTKDCTFTQHTTFVFVNERTYLMENFDRMLCHFSKMVFGNIRIAASILIKGFKRIDDVRTSIWWYNCLSRSVHLKNHGRTKFDPLTILGNIDEHVCNMIFFEVENFGIFFQK